MKQLFIIITLLIFIPLQGNEKREWRVYFTSPGRPAVSRRYGPAQALVKLIERSKVSIDMALYDLDLPSVENALAAAKKRGVAIRVVGEDKNMAKRGFVFLREENIPLRFDNRHGLMHNKFIIIDRELLWTGSLNITRNGVRKNNNNVFLIRSKDIVQIYQDEFDEMFLYGIFGNRKETELFTRGGKKYYVRARDLQLNIYFSPDDSVERIITKRIGKAQKSIYFMSFSFTSDSIGEAMIRKFRKGVMVKGLFERHGAKSRYSEYMKMKVEGVPVKLDRNRGIMHHKVIIIDNETVITGSYNFSKNANRVNDENTVIISSKRVARAYLKEFHRLYR